MNTLLLMPFGLGTGELLILFGIILLLFGGAKLKGVGRGMGEAISEFKKGMRDGEKPVDGTSDAKLGGNSSDVK